MSDFKNYNGENIELGLQATTLSDGLISASDKTKLDGIATGATKYVHPTTHPASIIVQDASNRFVTDTEKATWNAKASTTVATTAANGLMSAADKVKLDGIATGATKITIDTALNALSGNPVQNRVIYTALEGKASATDLTSHTNNKANPHGVTLAQIGAAAATHYHSAANINSGILAVDQGGTGQSTLAGTQQWLGVGLACSGYTSVSSGTLAAGVVTKIPLDEFHDTTSDEVFEISNGGIKVNRTGVVLVSGNVSIVISAQTTVGCHVYDGGRIAIEQNVLLPQSGGVNSGSRVLRVTAGDILYLYAYSKTAATYAGIGYYTRLDIVYIA